MNSLNKAQIIGNVTRDIELRKTQNGQFVCTVGVATNRKWKDANTGEMREDVEFHNVVCWGKLAEIVAQYLKKGTRVFFEGRLQTRNWEDDAGVKHFRTEIIAQDMIMLTTKAESEKMAAENSAAPNEPAPKKDEEEIKVSDEDLPF